MGEFFSKILQNLSEWNWPEIVKGIVSIWLATVATLALTTWKRHSKAQKQIDFLDELTDAVHEFINSMVAPTEMVKYIKIGIKSYADTPNVDPKIKNSEAVAYIKKEGIENSKKLLEYLKSCGPSLTKILSLAAKGQVLGLKNYIDCQNACYMLKRQHDSIQFLCYLIGSPSSNWRNSEVQKSLSEEVMQLDHEKIKKAIEAQNVRFLTFVKENYEKIYK
jgi:hypothetical protein